MRTILLSLLLAGAAFGQSGTPDCNFSGTITSGVATIPTSGGFNNKTTRCTAWRFTYYTNGASGVSVTLGGAADVAGSPGAFTALTPTQGTVNPAVGTAEGTVVAAPDFYPWIRVNAGTFTGTSQQMFVVVYGWKAPDTGPTSTSSGGVTSNVNVAQWNGSTSGEGGVAGYPGVGGVVASAGANAGKPVKTGGPFNTTQPTVTNGQIVDSQHTARGAQIVAPGVDGFAVTVSGSPNIDLDSVNGTASYGCGSQAAISISGSGSTQIVALSGSTVIRICHISLSTTPPENISFTSGTGSACATGTATLASYQTVSALAFDFGPFSPLSAGASNALCINQQNAQTTTGVVIYDQR